MPEYLQTHGGGRWQHEGLELQGWDPTQAPESGWNADTSHQDGPTGRSVGPGS